MRQKGDSASLAQRLNNALAQLHAQKLAFDNERSQFEAHFLRLKEQNEKLRTKNREMRRGQKQDDVQGLRSGTDGEKQQIVSKIQHYLLRVQQSNRQMAQVAIQCSVFDVEIEKAASQIEKNIIKSAAGLQKYIQELMRLWCQRQTLRLENERLQKQNATLFQLTTKLQQNFKQTDRLIKQMERKEMGQDRRQAVGELQNKIARLAQKVRSLEHENSTIKSIHQRTMKKLQKFQEAGKNNYEQGTFQGEGIKQQRRRWLEKTQEMYQQIRRLNRELLISEEAEKKVKQELAGCIQIYGHWQQERQKHKREVQELKYGLQQYLKKIQQLQISIVQKNGEIQAIKQRLEVSQGEKEKIISVYQLEVQQLNDQIFKKQDCNAELEISLSRQKQKIDDIKKQYADLSRSHQQLQQIHRKLLNEQQHLKIINSEQSQQIMKFEEKLQQIINQKNIEKQAKIKLNEQLHKTKQRSEQKIQQMAEMVQQYKEQYFLAKNQHLRLSDDIKSLQDEQFTISHQLRSIIETNDDTKDIWMLLSDLRAIIINIKTQNKNLKDSQRVLIEQFESKHSQTVTQLEEVTEQYENLRTTLDGEHKNEQASLKLFKIKLIQAYPEELIMKARNFKQLIETIVNLVKNIRGKSIDFDSNLKAALQLESNRAQQAEEKLQKLKNQFNCQNCPLLRQKLQLQSQNSKRFCQKLNLKQEENRSLAKQIQRILAQKQDAGKQMAELASQLNKMQEQFEDERSAIQSKLHNARQIAQRNEQLELQLIQMQKKIEQIAAQFEEQRNLWKSKQKDEENLQREENLLIRNSQISEKEAQNSQALLEINDLLRENEVITSQNLSKDMRISELQNALILLDENNRLLQERNNKLQDLYDTKCEQLDQYRNICGKIQAEEEHFSIMKSEIMQLKAKQQQKDEALNTLTNQNNLQYIQLTLQLQEKVNYIEELQLKLEKRNQQIQQLKQENQIALRKIAELSLPQLKPSNQQQNKINLEIMAREEQLQISLRKIHQKQLELKQERLIIDEQSRRVHQLMIELEREKAILIQEMDRLQNRQNMLFELETNLQKRQEQLKLQEKQHISNQRSLLGIDSLRQSAHQLKPFGRIEEQTIEQLRQELLQANRVLRQRQKSNEKVHFSHAELLEAHKKDMIEIEKYQKILAELEDEISEYREHSQSLKSNLAQVNQEKQKFLKNSQKLIEQKTSLQIKLKQLSNLLNESSIKNEILSQQLSKKSTLQDYVCQLKEKILMQKIQIEKSEGLMSQQKGVINEYKSIIQQKQSELFSRISQFTFQNESKNIKINIINQQKQHLNSKVIQQQKIIKQMERKIDSAQRSNLQYSEQIKEIQQTMEILKKEVEENEEIKMQLQESQIRREQLQARISQIGQSYSTSVNNFALFQKRNKELNEMILSCERDLQQTQRKLQFQIKQNEQLKLDLQNTKRLLAKYQILGSCDEIINNKETYRAQVQAFQDLKQTHSQSDKAVSSLKSKISQLERIITAKDFELSSKTEDISKMDQMNKKLKQMLHSTQNSTEQFDQLSRRNERLHNQIQQYKQQLLQKQGKILQLKKICSSLQTSKELQQELVRQKAQQYGLLQKQIEYYKLQIKKISKEKALAKNQAMKSKFTFDEQQSVFKTKESQLQEEIKKFADHEGTIKKLREEVDKLKESSSNLQESSLDSNYKFSRKISNSNSRQGKAESSIDIPLQIPLKSRQKSIQSEKSEKEEITKQQYEIAERKRQILQQQNRFLKQEISKADRTASKLRQTERSNIYLNSELQQLQRQLKGKSFNMQNLERQFKTKVEDYSKLQRIVESLRDQLNLEKKRVKNFEDLYQNIQQKRIKLSGNIKNQSE